VQAVLGEADLLALQKAVDQVPLADDVARYAVELVAATRPEGKTIPSDVAPFIDCGASPRASQAFIKGARARALMHGRAHVDFADIKALAPEILRHRLVLNFRARAEGLTPDDLIDRLLAQVKTKGA